MSDRPSGKNGRLLSTAKEINRSVINLLKDGVKKNVNVMERGKNSDESLSGMRRLNYYFCAERVSETICYDGHHEE